MLAARWFRLVLPLSVLLLTSGAAQAASRRWTPFGPPNGEILSLVADPVAAGRLYAVMESGQVFRSQDGGASWSWSGAGMTSGVYTLTPDPRRGGTLWAAGPDAVYRSDDYGTHWSRVSGPGFQPYPPPGPRSEQILLAAIPGRQPADPAILLFSGVAIGPFLRSTDGGRTWTPLAEPGPLWLLRTDARGSVYASLLNGGGLRRSDDAGLSWTPLGAISGDVEDLAASPARPRIVYAMTSSALWRSGDRGLTWLPMFSAPERYRLTALTVDPLEAGTVYVATTQDSITGALPSVWVSRDSGFTWQETGRGCVAGVILGMTVEPARRIIYAVSHADLAASPDFGLTWSHEIVSSTGFLSLGGHDQLRFDPRDPSRIHAVAGNLFTSRDGGLTWHAPGSPLGGLYGELNDVAFDPVRRGFLYGVTTGSLLLSKDGGATWSPYSSSGGLTMTFLGSRTVVLAGDGILRSTDRGHTWTRVLSNNPQGFIYRICDRLALDPADAQHLFAGCFTFDFTGGRIRYIGREMWQCRDGGLSWTLEATLEDVAFDPAHAGTVYGVSSFHTVLRSRDGGGSWEPAAGDSGPARVTYVAVDPLGSGAVYTLLETGKVAGSRDGGDTWSLLGGGNPPLRYYDGFWAHPTRPGQLYCAAQSAFFEMSVPP